MNDNGKRENVYGVRAKKNHMKLLDAEPDHDEESREDQKVVSEHRIVFGQKYHRLNLFMPRK